MASGTGSTPYGVCGRRPNRCASSRIGALGDVAVGCQERRRVGEEELRVRCEGTFELLVAPLEAGSTAIDSVHLGADPFYLREADLVNLPRRLSFVVTCHFTLYAYSAAPFGSALAAVVVAAAGDIPRDAESRAAS